nr:MAG TPA: hypothetical protein [Caudoviricetes sp.]
MQKVKKAAAQLDSRAAISVLNNLKNNQIVIENYEIFCELYERAIVCEDCSLAPLFSDGSFIVKQKINDDCIDLIINFSVNFTEKGSILANLECLRLDFFAKNGFSEDNTAPTIKAIENKQQQFKYIGKIKIEYNLDSGNIIEWENSLTSVLVRRGYVNPIEYLNAQNDVEEIRANLKACIDLFKGALICADYLLKHPEEKHKERHARSHNGNNSSNKSFQKQVDSVQVISLNSLRFKTENKKVANMLKSKKVHRIAESWSVRGHYRHYKSGKVIFIESFEKGKKRKQASQKKIKYKL